MATALLIVDVQGDFLPGGALGVPEGDAVVAPLARLAPAADHVVASRDLHPADHVSFLARGGPWPEHAVVGTPGAELHPLVTALDPDRVVAKGESADLEAYSAFDGTDLAAWLRARGVDRLLVGGLATDYCVRASALDALAAGFAVDVAADACRAVDLLPGDGARALQEIEEAGGRVTSTAELVGDDA